MMNERKPERKHIEVISRTVVGETAQTAQGFFVIRTRRPPCGKRQFSTRTLFQKIAGEERRVTHLDVVRALARDLADLLDRADDREEDWSDR